MSKLAIGFLILALNAVSFGQTKIHEVYPTLGDEDPALKWGGQAVIDWGSRAVQAQFLDTMPTGYPAIVSFIAGTDPDDPIPGYEYPQVFSGSDSVALTMLDRSLSQQRMVTAMQTQIAAIHLLTAELRQQIQSLSTSLATVVSVFHASRADLVRIAEALEAANTP